MRRSPQNVRIACNHAGMTHFGGAYFFHEFFRVLQLQIFLEHHLIHTTRNDRSRAHPESGSCAILGVTS